MSELAILCVDDEVVILDSLKEQLKRCFGDQYIYEVAESADEAWEVIEELQEDEINIIVIVSDWLMPGTKGDEFLIQVHQKFPQLIKIMLTGQADETAIQNAVEQANLHACLHKPWTEEQLSQIITSALK
ncbi:Response regulator with CheY-like receiver, AAA-type ATPase, and DNA-binding domains [Hyella patelloides LEGE 07179]|uniref:Response regulator with CheY-like receiver, AAA-type ATPase, and DNA-binding domains n=1 Tax=Hyella patelloides LEGE 07179 TaxID=945734 RepID=A0A563VJM5_9CYAN|nr:response regulator [Hyella patelloides]VEP11629.1 Response regulator with CheY-like receiver, AAA-type ATPase, and DNA-binding domains [Hyella patelloides LEGE 07179]